MTLKLPDLPYAYDALQPYMSAETLQFHHDKHHQAYVDMTNKLIPGSKYEGKSSRDLQGGVRRQGAAGHQQRRPGLQSHLISGSG